jgi:hypothetical protein
MKPTERKIMPQNALTETVGSILFVAAALVVAHHADKLIITGLKKARPALKIPKLSKVKS